MLTTGIYILPSAKRVASATWADVGIEKDLTFEASGG